MINIKYWGIKKRVIYLTFTPILSITILLSVYFVTTRINDVRQFIHNRGTTLAKHLAPASEYALLTGNRELIQSLANSVLTESDVVSVSISNKSKSISVISFTDNEKLNKSLSIDKHESPRLLSFHQVVKSKGFLVFDYTDEFESENSKQTIIGEVTIALSLKSTLLREQQIIYGGIGIAIIGLILSLLMALYFGRSITQPILKLTHMGKILRQGDLTARVTDQSGGEVGELEVTFNDLASNLEKSQLHLLDKVETATLELRTTVALLETKNTELEEARTEAVRAGKSKSDFLAKMSHEIRTPMNAVMGFTQLLIKTQQTDDQYEYTRTINQSATQLLTILDDILSYSKIDSGTIEMECTQFDVQQCMEDVICMLAPSAHQKELELVLLLGSDIPRQVTGIPTRISQVLTNLVNNAIKFTKSGSVTVKVSLQSNTRSKSDLKVNVIDTGIGVESDKQPNLFDEFIQVDSSISRSYGGTGLGLAIAKRLVNLMGGEIGIKSQTKRGSDFWFTIPVKTNSIPAEREFNSIEGLSALVVDTHAFSRRAIRNNLLRCGATIYVQRNIKTTFENIQYQSIDMLLLGVNQQEYDQLDMNYLENIQKLYNIKILLLVGTEDPQSRLSLLTNPDIAIMSKPFRRDTFHRNIEQLLGLNVQISTSDNSHLPQPELPTYALAGISILAVEDNEFNQSIIKTFLQQHGVVISQAFNGSEAIEKVKYQKYDLILMDIHMPVCNGIEAVKYIRANNNINKHTPIVALTADVYATERDDLCEIGFNEVMLKPIVEEHLISIVNSYATQITNKQTHSADIDLHNKNAKSIDTNMSAPLPKTLMNRFHKEMPLHIEALNSAFDGNNREQLIYHAHLIHGLAGYFGQQKFIQSARILEQAARKDQANLADCIIRLNLLYKEIK